MASHGNRHPLPALPPQQPQQQQQQQPQDQHHPQQSGQQVSWQQHQSRPSQASQVQKQERTRPRSRAFSFLSDKSQKSSGSHPNKNELHETTAEKEAKRLHGKADPRMALNEVEPSMEAQNTKSLASLRSIQHRDAFGNPISDPDRSNPTRNRWERPLDTIKAFEAAVDGGYNNRQSMIRSDTESVANWNRRSSYYGNNGPRFPQESYYGGRPESGMFDPRQSAMMGGPRDSNYGGLDGGPYGNGPPNGNGVPYGNNGMGNRMRASRMQSEPWLNGRGTADRNVYPTPNNHRSYETVASGSGSGSMGEQAGYQTDPTSSENSSIDRRSPPKRQEPTNDYGISFGQAPTYQPPSFSAGSNYGGPPQVPRKENGSILRKPSKAAVRSQERPPAPEKRKSWLFRRFSKTN